MENIFTKNTHACFDWSRRGDIAEGRPNLGGEMPVLVYRLLEYTAYDVLCHELGEEAAKDLFRKFGYKAGHEFALHVLDLSLELDAFLADTAKKLLDLKIGVLRVEQMDPAAGEFTVTVGEDLDCSGLPVTGETVCNYDEGFLAGIFDLYTKGKYTVREVDCWASGDRVCRFEGHQEK